MEDKDQIYQSIQNDVQLEIAAALKKYSEGNQYGLSNIPTHEHSGTDTSQVSYMNLYDRHFLVKEHLFGSVASTANYYGVLWIAPFICNVLTITEVHGSAGTNGGAVTLNIEKLTGTQALDAGVTLLSTAFNLKSTINTPVAGTMTPILSSKQMAKGDRLAMKDSGTLTDVGDVCVIIELTY